MSKMLEQFQELLTMQKALDATIFREKGIKEYPFENMKIALFVELGEMMNEFPTEFKHWKSTAVDDREKGLVEYVDCLHFALSLCTTTKMCMDCLDYNREFKIHHFSLFSLLSFTTSALNNNDYDTVIYDLFQIGNWLGFTWEEIYQTYMKKNAINYQRLKNGY